MPVPLQFDACRTRGGSIVVVVQSDLLEETATRVVVPLVKEGRSGRGLRSLNPEIVVGGVPLILLPQQLATITVREVAEIIANVAPERDRITRAVDALLSGI